MNGYAGHNTSYAFILFIPFILSVCSFQDGF
jgi:hypothetical protein